MRKKRKGAFHEPTVWCPGFSRSGPPEGGTPNKFCRTVRFKVPMHGTKVEGAFHEPQGRAGVPPAAPEKPTAELLFPSRLRARWAGETPALLWPGAVHGPNFVPFVSVPRLGGVRGGFMVSAQAVPAENERRLTMNRTLEAGDIMEWRI